MLRNSDAHDPANNTLLVSSMQKKWRDSFADAALDPSLWISSAGAGGSLALSAGTLVMGSGTVANDVVSVLSTGRFTNPFRLVCTLSLSQRIVNQTFIIELVSIDPATGIPDGKHGAAWLFDGSTVTNAKYRVWNGGLAALDSAAVTITTTATMALYEIELFPDEVWFHQRAMDSVAARNYSNVRHQQLPDPNAYYALRLKWVNGAIAPASNTNAVFQSVLVMDYSELTAEITGGRGVSAAGQGIGVLVAGAASGYNLPVNMAQIAGGAPSVQATGILNVATYGGAATNGLTNSELVSAASNNATVLKASAGRLFRVVANNINAAARYLKIYNKATAPAPATDIPILVFMIPPNSQVIWESPLGLYCSAGISFVLVTGIANTDNTSVAAAEHVVSTGHT